MLAAKYIEKCEILFPDDKNASKHFKKRRSWAWWHIAFDFKFNLI